MIKVTRFQCDFCNRTYAAKAAAAKHEDKCPHNPKNKACVTCEYFVDEKHSCVKGKITPTPASKMNPHGLVANCDWHRKQSEYL